jgi:hypothetical protein
VGHAAGAGRGRVRHNGNRRALKEIRQFILIHVSRELDIWTLEFFLHRFHIAVRLRMISPANHKLRVWKNTGNDAKSLDHQLQPLVGAPFAKRQYAVLRIAAPGKIRILRSLREYAVRTKVNVIAPIFLVQNFPVSRHEHGNRIRKQQHSCGERPRHTIEARVPNARVLQIHSIHQMMQGHMRVAAAHARHQRGKQAQKSVQGIAPECAEQQVEPHHIRFYLPESFENPRPTSRIVEPPASFYGETIQFGLRR